jgi:hypothetical protein
MYNKREVLFIFRNGNGLPKGGTEKESWGHRQVEVEEETGTTSVNYKY